tara:strand:+ start:300 stop:632 length:333 start_codon:yes stop_codon:yes gene_type:complete
MDFSEYLRFGLALVFVIGLIGLMATIARRAGFGFPIKAIKPSGRRRISIVEVTPLDGRRRLVLIRCDKKEHLLLLGPSTELVVANDISSNSNQSKDFPVKYRENVGETID